MKVFVDARMLYKSGIGRYIRNILQETLLLDKELTYLLAGSVEESSYFRAESLLSDLQIKSIDYNNRIYTISEQVRGSILAFRHASCDVFFYPHYNVPWLCPENSVVTIHDLIHFKLKNFYNPGRVKAAGLVLKNGVCKAGRIIVISQSTKNDLMEMFPSLSPSKIQVIYQGVDPRIKPASITKVTNLKQKLGLGKYILYVGNRLQHKNLGRLIKAYAEVIHEIHGLQLVICGSRFKKRDEIDQLKQKYDLHGLIEVSSLSDDDLSALYTGAEAFVLPSLYEGFGLPVLEAMACNTPVIAANTSSLPEVVGDAGVYFDPYNIEEMSEQIYHVLKNGAIREKLIKQGLEQVKKFNWAKTAAETLDVFRQAAMIK